jgi:DDE superfamily endonuclease
LIRWAASRPEWALGFGDEVWWSREAQPSLSAWTTESEALRLVDQAVPKDDPDPKALACYGLLLLGGETTADAVWLRFVEGRPVSGQTIPFLAWCLDKLAQAGKKALLLIWDNASWHVSRAVRDWIKAHNRAVKQSRQGVRLVICRLPSKSPWLNRIEPRWTHGKRRVVEPARLLSAQELMDRVYAAYGCPHLPLLPMPQPTP